MSEEKKIDVKGKLVGYAITLEEAMGIDKPIVYFIGSDGVYELRKTPIGSFITKSNLVIGKEPVQEGFLSNFPKIPYVFYIQILKFFKNVGKESDVECLVEVWYDKEKGEYFMNCPVQKVSGTSISYEREESMHKDNNLVCVLEIHSHNIMSAIFSPIDDKDEIATRFYGVVGRVNTKPEYSFRMGVEGKYRKIPFESIFGNPENLEEIKNAEFPIEWKEKIEVIPQKYTTYQKFNKEEGTKKTSSTKFNLDLSRVKPINSVKQSTKSTTKKVDSGFKIETTDLNKECSSLMSRYSSLYGVEKTDFHWGLGLNNLSSIITVLSEFGYKIKRRDEPTKIVFAPNGSSKQLLTKVMNSTEEIVNKFFKEILDSNSKERFIQDLEVFYEVETDNLLSSTN